MAVALLMLLFGVDAVAQTPPAPKPYTLAVQLVPAGNGQGEVLLSVATPDNYKVNKEFPLSLTATASAGVILPKASQKIADAREAADHKLVMGMPYAIGAGTAQPAMDVKFVFGVCELKNGEVTRCTFHREEQNVSLVPLAPPASGK